MIKEEQHCQALVDEPPGYWHTHFCLRNATTNLNGLRLCSQHAKKALARPILIDAWKKGPR